MASQVPCALSHSRMRTETQISRQIPAARPDTALARSLDEIRAAGSVVLEGTDVADATGGAIQSAEFQQQRVRGRSDSYR